MLWSSPIGMADAFRVLGSALVSVPSRRQKELSHVRAERAGLRGEVVVAALDSGRSSMGRGPGRSSGGPRYPAQLRASRRGGLSERSVWVAPVWGKVMWMEQRWPQGGSNP